MIAARVAMAMGLVALLAGCFDSKEDQATAAYRTRDFAAARSVLAHLMHMVAEGRAACDGEPDADKTYRNP